MNPLLTANISISLSSPVVLICQLFLVAVNFYLLMWVCRSKCDGIKRSLAFVFSVFFTFFYQIPSVLYGSYVIQNMPEPIWFLAVINIVPITLGVWLASTQSFFLGGKTKIEFAKEKYGFSRDERRSIFILAFASTFCIVIYLYLIPFRCTGLWAMINDPEAVLLARELSMKLNGYPMVNRIYGFYINVIAPLVCFFGIYFSYRFFRQRFLFASLLWLFVAGIVIPTFYIGGIKGALANAVIFIVVSIVSTPQIMRAKVIMAFATFIVFVGSVLLFELARDRANGDLNHEYNFAACAKGFSSCEEASSLIKSAGIRPEGSLGLRPFRIDKYRTQLNQTCWNLESAEQSRALASPLPRPRIFELFEASMVRLFRVPFQVSTWHFINASADSSIRWSVIPLLNRFDTARRNISEEVYQKFGAFYSRGDVTSTSTAPTSFVLQYSAYLGLVGLFLSLILIIVADTVSRFFYQRLSSPLIFGFSGYVVTVAYNMISSDFFTVLFSHGAFLGFCFFYLLSGCSILTKFRQRV